MRGNPEPGPRPELPLSMHYGLGLRDEECMECGEMYVQLVEFVPHTDGGRALWGEGFMIALGTLPPVIGEHLREVGYARFYDRFLMMCRYAGKRAGVRVPYRGYCSPRCESGLGDKRDGNQNQLSFLEDM